MKSTLFRTIPWLFVALVFAGCSSTPDSGDGAGAGGASVTDAGGAQTAGASQGGAWGGSPLDDPQSPLSNKTIYFDYDSSEIHPDYRQIVISHGEYLAANPSMSVTVEGHCDERGSREYNIGLGERRADAVKRLLLAQGAATSQVVTISYGEERPLAFGADEASWAQNRRAQLVY
jgi:peptidoglycan-associated lipoprotein